MAIGKSTLLFTSLILLGACGNASGRTWTLGVGGEYDFTSLAVACSTAVGGDSIRIAPGAYTEPDQISLISKPLAFIGTGATPDDTRLAFRMFIYTSSGVLFANLSIRNSNKPIDCDASGVSLTHCTIRDNATTQEANIVAFDATTLVLEDCLLSNNSGELGGAVWGAGFVARRCTFVDNRASTMGGAVCSYANSVIENCIFWRNTAPTGAAMTLYGGHDQVRNCTLYGNIATGVPGSAFEAWGLMPYVDNVIIAGTIGGAGADCADDPKIFRCSDFWNNEGGVGGGLFCAVDPYYGGFQEDPMFCDPEHGDFRLSEGSPCLPGHHGNLDCGLVGALDQGCNLVPAKRRTWGEVKQMFR